MASATWFGDTKEPFIISRIVHGYTSDSFQEDLNGVVHFLETLFSVQHLIPPSTFRFTLDNSPVATFPNSPKLFDSAANIDRPYSPQKRAIRNNTGNIVDSVKYQYVKYHQDEFKS